MPHSRYKLFQKNKESILHGTGSYFYVFLGGMRTLISYIFVYLSPVCEIIVENKMTSIRNNNDITFQDAVRITGPLAFNIMIKPAGSLCNLDCHYCYYLDKAEIYGGKEPRMSYATLEAVIKSYIAANEVPEVTFNWHGGEPLVLGIDFFKKAVELEKIYADGKIIHNTIQTNGTLLNREWSDFLAKENFLTGISIDGPAEIHNKYRKDKGGAPTFDKVINGIALLKSSGVEFNTMTTINRASSRKGLEVYQFLKSIGSRYMQFMPVLEHIKYPLGANGRPGKKSRPYIVNPSATGAELAQWSTNDMDFGHFMCDIFDYWVLNDVGQYFVNIFDSALARWCGAMPGTCVYAETCGGNSIIEHNGDLYPCDHFVYPEYKLGNILQDDLKTMMTSEAQTKFGIDKRNSLPSKCLRCEWKFACNGECPKHRFNKTENGTTGLNALCEGYRLFFRHISPYMDKMRELLSQQQSPAGVMPWARMKKI